MKITFSKCVSISCKIYLGKYAMFDNISLFMHERLEIMASKRIILIRVRTPIRQDHWFYVTVSKNTIQYEVLGYGNYPHIHFEMIEYFNNRKKILSNYVLMKHSNIENWLSKYSDSLELTFLKGLLINQKMYEKKALKFSGDFL